MKRKILLTVSSKEFFTHTAKPLIADDTNAYEIVLQTPYDLTGVIFSITAIRSDGVTMSDTGAVGGNTATYTMKNSMYSVAGETRFRLTLVKDETTLTEAELLCDVISGNGSPDLSGDDRVPALQALIGQTSMAITGASVATSSAEKAKDDLLAAAENGEFDGTWDDTTEYENLTTTDKTVIGSINELNYGKVDKVTGKSLSTEDYTLGEKTKLYGIAAGANNYIHPASHSADMIDETATRKWASPAEKTTWNTKADPTKMFYPNNQYGGIVADNLNTISVTGFYTCYDSATGSPFEDSSAFVIHYNSNAGTVSAFQMARAHTDGRMLYRDKRSSTWTAWSKQPSEQIAVIDAGNHFAGTNVESVLQEVAASLDKKADSETADGGGAIGGAASSNEGGSVGGLSHSANGGAIGRFAWTNNGGAVGDGSKSGDGFAGGLGATTTDMDDIPINAVQLGTGNNDDPLTLKVYGTKIVNADGKLTQVELEKTFALDTTSTTATLSCTSDVLQGFTQNLTALTLTGTDPADGKVHNRIIHFKSGGTATTFTAPDFATYGWYFSGDDCLNGVFAPKTNSKYELNGSWVLGTFGWAVKKWA